MSRTPIYCTGGCDACEDAARELGVSLIVSSPPAQARTAVPEIDVERLARALTAHGSEFLMEPESFDGRTSIARNIVAHYVRLAATAPQEPPCEATFFPTYDTKDQCGLSRHHLGPHGPAATAPQEPA